MNGILINIKVICVWIGNLQPHLWRFRPAAGIFYMYIYVYI